MSRWFRSAMGLGWVHNAKHRAWQGSFRFTLLHQAPALSLVQPFRCQRTLHTMGWPTGGLDFSRVFQQTRCLGCVSLFAQPILRWEESVQFIQARSPTMGLDFTSRHSAAGKVPTVLGMMSCWGVSFHTTSGRREAGERWDGTETLPSRSHPADGLGHRVCIVLSDRRNDRKHLYQCK